MRAVSMEVEPVFSDRRYKNTAGMFGKLCLNALVSSEVLAGLSESIAVGRPWSWVGRMVDDR